MVDLIVECAAEIAVVGGVGVLLLLLGRPVHRRLVVAYLATVAARCAALGSDVTYDDLNRAYGWDQVPITRLGQGLPFAWAIQAVKAAERILAEALSAERERWTRHLEECDRSIPRSLLVSDSEAGCLGLVAAVGVVGAFQLLGLLAGHHVDLWRLVLTVTAVVVPFAVFALEGWTVVRGVLNVGIALRRSRRELRQILGDH